MNSSKPLSELSACLALYHHTDVPARQLLFLLQQQIPLNNVIRDPRHYRLQLTQPWPWLLVEQALAWLTASAQRHIIYYTHPLYPELLAHIASPPPVLYLEGQITALAKTHFAIVGSRHPSSQARDNAYQFAYHLAEQHFTIVSGLAAGIDLAAHEGTLAAHGITIAVMGTGLKKIYPEAHRSLATSIIDQGLLISEFPLDSEPKRQHFPRRNRIISGLSIGVLVVEAALQSGSLITARYAVEQGRDVYAIPGSIHHPCSKGCHHLIKQGAKLVENVQDILDELPQTFTTIQNDMINPDEKIDKHLLAKNAGAHIIPPIKIESNLSVNPLPHDWPHLLLSYLDNDPTNIDTLARRSGYTLPILETGLTLLEIEEKIIKRAGGYEKVRIS